MLQKELILPPRNGQAHNETLVCCEPVVIIGANGSGKSRLGFWIEQNHPTPEKVHRISAQRALDFPEYIKLKSHEQAENEFLVGTADRLTFGRRLETKKSARWQLGNRPPLSVTPMLNDYEKVLAVLFAKKLKGIAN